MKSSSSPPERLLIQATEPEKVINRKLIKLPCGLNGSLKRMDVTSDCECRRKRAHLRSWYAHQWSCGELSPAFYFCLQMPSNGHCGSHRRETRLCFLPWTVLAIMTCIHSWTSLCRPGGCVSFITTVNSLTNVHVHSLLDWWLQLLIW